VVALTTRLPLALADGGWPIGEVWDDTVVHVGDVGRVTDVLTDRLLPVVDGRVRLSDAFAILPVALLECM
jgi:maltooligosyltrehalose synthase